MSSRSYSSALQVGDAEDHNSSTQAVAILFIPCSCPVQPDVTMVKISTRYEEFVASPISSRALPSRQLFKCSEVRRSSLHALDGANTAGTSALSQGVMRSVVLLLSGGIDLTDES